MNTKNVKLFMILILITVTIFFGAVERVKAENNAWTRLGLDGLDVQSIAVSPHWPVDQTIACGGWYMPGTFYITSDGGTTWSYTHPLESVSYYNHFDSIALSPDYEYGSLDQTVFLGGGNQAWVYLSTDSGSTWFRDDSNISGDKNTWDFAVSPIFSTDRTVFVAGNNGVYKSIDGGISFLPFNIGLPSGSHMALGISPDYSTDQIVFVGTYYGVFKSTDGGSSWYTASNGLPPSYNYSNPVIYDIAISPNYVNDKTLFAGVNTKGVYRSADGGVNWTLVYPDAYAIGFQGLAISPNYATDSTLFIGTMGVVMSRDGGDTWTQMGNDGFISEVDIATPDVVVSPNFLVDGRIFVGTRDGVWTTTITTNSSPVAEAGSDQSIYVGELVTLDGSGSSDPDENYPLNYAWTIASKPDSSEAFLENNEITTPTFTADLPGDYFVELIVTDSLGQASLPDTVLASTINSTPVAAAGTDQSITFLGTIVQLDGDQSYDEDGDSITFLWSMTNKPQDSLAMLSDPTSSSPAFDADQYGEYSIQLVVSDPWVASVPDTVVVSFENLRPVAQAGVSQSILVGKMVYLDGSSSSDENLDPLAYSWSIVSKPPNSIAELTGPDQAESSLIPDVAGEYIISLTVNDGFLDSVPSNVSILALATQNIVTEILTDGQEVINGLDSDLLKNVNLENSLGNKISVVLGMIDDGRYEDARDKLENDILGKVDGCIANGEPDKDDWITDCDSQFEIYMQVIDAIELLETLD